MTYDILDKISSPSDIRHLDITELEKLCAEIRDYMIECCSINPGHLGSSLGAVELIVGLHYIYNTPKDKIVFDVGHQAYAHKILTGRKTAFRMNRKKDGISGFTKRTESQYDIFGAGHSSTSISAALGLAESSKLLGTGEKVVALIGDGALSGGLAFEGLNNAGSSKTDLLVIINDNNISIDKNIGAIHEHLLRITTDPTYNKLKKHVWDRMGEGNFRRWIQKMTVNAKSSMVSSSGGALFEAMGFRYFGPVDGNDIAQVTDTLLRLKDIKGPRILHTITKKGKGYAPAEEQQTIWHAPGIFDPVTGKRIKSSANSGDRYQDVFGEVLLELARMDTSVVGVTPAMATGCGMDLLAKEIPDRFFDVGIAEEHAVTFSAGLAAGGAKPFCNIYSSFSQRAYDQIIHDVALQELPVVLCFDRSGLVGEDGATHHGAFDMSAYRSIPNTVIAVPANEAELKHMMFTAYLRKKGPFIIRYPRGLGEGVEWRSLKFEEMPEGKSELLLEGTRVAVVAAGYLANRAYEVAVRLREETGICPAVYNLRYLKPLDIGMLEDIRSRFHVIVTIEDGSLAGGLYGAVCEYVSPFENAPRVIGLGIPDMFIEQGTQKEERAECGIDNESIYACLKEQIEG